MAQKPDDIFAGGGEMGKLMRSHPWHQSPFGAAESWSISLKTAVNICLNAYFPTAIWWGEDFRLLYNDAFRPILGRHRHPQSLGRPAQVVFPESWHVIGAQLEGVLETQQANREENIRLPVLRQGYLEESYYTYSYSPLRDEAGRVRGVFTVLNETTSQILSERRLAVLTALSAHRYTANTTDEIYRLTAQSLAQNPADIPFSALYCLEANHAQAVLYEATSAPYLPQIITLGQSDSQSDPQSDPWLFAQVLQTKSGLTVDDVAGRLVVTGAVSATLPEGVFSLPVGQARVLPVCASGQYASGQSEVMALLVLGINPAIALDAEYSTFFDAIAAHLATAITNTNAHKTEQALLASEGKLKSFFDANVVGILFGDVDNAIYDANDEFLRIVGYSRDDLQARGLHWKDITPPDYSFLDEIAISEARATGACTPYEKEYIRKDGSRVPVLVGFNLIGDRREDLVAFILDISDRKKTEIEREQSLVREHTAREAAERASQIKDEFLAVISHELRTPLNPILGWTQMLRRGALNGEKTAFALETIERNARLQVQLISDLLDISSVLRGKMRVSKQPIDLKSAILSALETVQLAAEQKSLTLELNLSPTHPCVVIGDAGRLQQVIWNLLSNAVKFTPAGGQVSVTLKAIERVDGLSAQLQVSDTGKGIAADFLPYVFEYFRQEDYSTTRQFGGLGLGMAIARQLTELHGGTIRADSTGEDRGATFTIKIPLAASQKMPMPPEESPLDSSARLSGFKVLVVDDEPDSLEITAFALQQAGAVVTTASSGSAALAAIHQAPPDILISDIGMPGMDGYMLIKQVRALPAEQGGRTVALALTAYADELDLRQAIAAGFQRHLTKPIDPDELVKAIEEALQ
ncbi:MAG: ATP-binding protein [Phormidesmis sp.]